MGENHPPITIHAACKWMKKKTKEISSPLLRPLHGWERRERVHFACKNQRISQQA